jgi:hypothetical protein
MINVFGIECVLIVFRVATESDTRKAQEKHNWKHCFRISRNAVLAVNKPDH